jgi:prophage DNA circulation protein
VLLNTSRARGRRLVRAERPLRDGAAISELTEEDVLRGLLEEIAPLVER